MSTYKNKRISSGSDDALFSDTNNNNSDKKYVTIYFVGTTKLDYQGYHNANGKRNGTGTSYWRGNGKKIYEGDWKEGKYHGEGTLYDSTGRKIYEGQFVQGKKTGHGTEFGWEREVKVYVGDFKDGDRCGAGSEFDPVTGNKVYQGQFKDGSRHGDGVKYEYNGNILANKIYVTYENGILIRRNTNTDMSLVSPRPTLSIDRVESTPTYTPLSSSTTSKANETQAKPSDSPVKPTTNESSIKETSPTPSPKSSLTTSNSNASSHQISSIEITPPSTLAVNSPATSINISNLTGSTSGSNNTNNSSYIKKLEDQIAELRDLLEKERKEHEGKIREINDKNQVEMTSQEKQLLTSMWKVDWKDVKLIGERIGIGGFAEVFKGEYRGTQVAVKVLLKQNLKGKKLGHFLDEVTIMSRLRHPNILLFIGASIEDKYAILTEFMDGGDLMKLLKNEDIQLSLEQKIKIAKDVARAVNYLHTSNPTVIHRDLKSENVLLDKHMNCKISDFGLTKIKEANSTFSDVGTPQWMAPEIKRGEKYDEKVDVFAYGVVLWEIYTRKKPRLLPDGQRQLIPDECPYSYSKLIQDCWHFNPNKRPTFTQILERLSELLQDLPKSN